MRFLFLLVVATVGAPAVGQVHRCTVGGQVVYQQAPCPGAVVAVPKSFVVPPEVPRLAPGAARPSSAELIENARAARKNLDDMIDTNCVGKDIKAPAIGMSELDVRCIAEYRMPDRVNITQSESGTRSQYVYRHQYLYFRNGRLASISSNY